MALSNVVNQKSMNELPESWRENFQMLTLINGILTIEDSALKIFGAMLKIQEKQYGKFNVNSSKFHFVDRFFYTSRISILL